MNFNPTYRGFDVSFYQDDNGTPQTINFETMHNWGSAFVIIRAGQGAWIDPDFLVNWHSARMAGNLRAAYWFYDPRVDPMEQAESFAALFMVDKPEGRLWVDLEFPDEWGGDYRSPANWRRFMERVRALTGLRVGVYTAAWWWDEWAYLGLDLSYFYQFPLWVAQYTSDVVAVRLPIGWQAAYIWQDSTPAIGPYVGVESLEIDHNFWNGNFDFAAEWGRLPYLPIGGMMKYGRVNTSVLNVRKGPGTSYADLGDVVLNDYLIASEDVGGWWHLTDARRGGWEGPAVALSSGVTVADRATQTNDVWCKASYVVLVAPPPDPDPEPDPEPDPDPGASLVHTIEVFNDGSLKINGNSYP